MNPSEVLRTYGVKTTVDAITFILWSIHILGNREEHTTHEHWNLQIKIKKA
jgi:hypothetical protein